MAEGRPVPWDSVELLVNAVLDLELVQLARAVTEGGPHAVMRAVQLAGTIAAAAAPDANTEPTRADPGSTNDRSEGGAA